MNTTLRTNGFDVLNRLTNRLDGLGQTRYTYVVLSHGLHTVTEDGPWAADEVTVTNRFGRRAGLRIAQPARAFVVTNACDAAGRWAVVDGTAKSRSWQGVWGSRLPACRLVFPSVQDAGGIGGLVARSRHATCSPYAVTGSSFYHADGNGNVTYLASSSGGTDAAYRYDPFGRWLAQTGSYASANVMRFSSKSWLAHNSLNTDGLYSYGYRFYDPYLQRWLNRDPLGEAGSYNLYAFVHNNPINYLDPLGLKVRIKGPKDFKNRVKECIKALRKSKRGKELYDDAKKSKNITVIIQPAPDPSGPYAGEPPRAVIGLDPNDPIFVGPEASIRQYPDEIPPYDPNDKKSVAKVCACVLGHELGHAFLDLDDPPEGRNVENVENPIRIELGLPPRRSYHGIPIAP